MKIVNEIFDLFEKRGGTAYFGEPVSIVEHCLQAAHLAENARGSSSLVVAALLHDIGHLIHNLPEDIGNRGIDSKHEDLACEWLSPYFGPEVTEPIRLHVAAKRFLCHVDPSYMRQLSPASMLSLDLQGGPLVDDAAEDFVRSPYSQQALLIRHWDDSAKVPGLRPRSAALPQPTGIDCREERYAKRHNNRLTVRYSLSLETSQQPHPDGRGARASGRSLR